VESAATVVPSAADQGTQTDLLKDIGLDLLTLTEAASLPESNITASSFRTAILRGRLPARKLGSIWVVSRADALSYLHSRQVGRPPREPSHRAHLTVSDDTV
jgi:hypothetical protein